MSHASIPAEVRAARGLPDHLVRISVGMEHPQDLLAGGVSNGKLCLCLSVCLPACLSACLLLQGVWSFSVTGRRLLGPCGMLRMFYVPIQTLLPLCGDHGANAGQYVYTRCFAGIKG